MYNRFRTDRLFSVQANILLNKRYNIKFSFPFLSGPETGFRKDHMHSLDQFFVFFCSKSNALLYVHSGLKRTHPQLDSNQEKILFYCYIFLRSIITSYCELVCVQCDNPAIYSQPDRKSKNPLLSIQILFQETL